MSKLLRIILLSIYFVTTSPLPLKRESNGHRMHPPIDPRVGFNVDEEKIAKFWHDKAIETLKAQLKIKKNENVAKNVILFLGDGMSIATITATRVYIGGENKQLSFEKFPHTAMSKTYNANYQVPDSASTATAYLGGVKTNFQTIGVTANVSLGDCKSMMDDINHVLSIARWSQLKNKSTGVVTTTRITHATPAGVYAHTANRRWEADANIVEDRQDPKICTDIAHQLVYGETGKNLNVMFGGGRSNFLSKSMQDETNQPGWRLNGNLIQEWKDLKAKDKEKTSKYIWNRDQLLSLDAADHVLGLFHNTHIPYNLDRDVRLIPSLQEMTEAAIKILSKNEKGYFLLVEGGLIDRGHHKNLARKALDETAEFSKAIQAAVDKTSENDTLIVVTADHAHGMQFTGYSSRGHDILGLSESSQDVNLTIDGKPYTTITYSTGPGYKEPAKDGSRYNMAQENLSGKDYQYPSLAPTLSANHGGDDVAIFARGPWAHLYTGVIEENVIPHLMAYASCVGDQLTICSQREEEENMAFGLTPYWCLMLACFALLVIIK